MQRVLHLIAVLGVLLGIVVMVVLLFWLGAGRRQAGLRDQSDVRLVAAKTEGGAAAFLGLTLQPVTSIMRKKLGLPRSGVVVSDVAAGSPAAQAGVARGDMLRQVAGTAISKAADVQRALKEVAAGDRVRVTVWRKGQQQDVDLVAGAPPLAPPGAPAALPEAEVEVEVAWLGLDIVPLSPTEAAEAKVGAGVRGMLVDDVADGRGVDAGLTTGDVILAINGKPTRSIAEFREATKDAVGALVDVMRNARHLYVSIPPPGTSPAERRLMQQRLPVTKVGWDGAWGAPGWAPQAPAYAAPAIQAPAYGAPAPVDQQRGSPAAPLWPVRPANWDSWWWLSPGWQAQATLGWQRLPASGWQQQPASGWQQRPAARPAGWDVPFGRPREAPARGAEQWRFRQPEVEWRMVPGVGVYAMRGQ